MTWRTIMGANECFETHFLNKVFNLLPCLLSISSRRFLTCWYYDVILPWMGGEEEAWCCRSKSYTNTYWGSIQLRASCRSVLRSLHATRHTSTVGDTQNRWALHRTTEQGGTSSGGQQYNPKGPILAQDARSFPPKRERNRSQRMRHQGTRKDVAWRWQ